MPNLSPLVLLLCSMSSALHAAVQDDQDFAKVVQPFVENHCIDCHDADSARAGFRIDTLGTDFAAGNNAGLWKEVMDKINSGEMPPKKKKRPDPQAAFEVATWVAKQLEETTKVAQGAGGRVPLRRMNRVEYANTVRDLFTLDANYARRIEKELPADGKVGGFDRGAAGLFMDESQLAQYMAVADMVLGEAVFLEKPKVTRLTWDNTRERFIHGIGIAYLDEAGKIVDDNPPPALAALVKEPLARIKLDSFEGKDLEKTRYVPHGPLSFAVRNGGIEFLSGGDNHRNPGNLRGVFFPNDWAKKGVSRDGWYRFRVEAGAFAGEGAEAQQEVRLVLEYNYGTPIQVVQSVVIDAPLDEPKEYEFLMYLQAGPPNMNRSWELGWDNGGKDVVIVNPEYQVPQWKPVLAGGDLQEAIVKKKSAEEIAALRKKSEEALAAAEENRKTFPGPMFIYDPKLDIAKRPRLWLGKMEWEGPLVEWPPKGQSALFFAGDERTEDDYLRGIFVRFLPRAYRRPATTAEVDGVVGWTLKLQAERQWSFSQAVREGVKNVLCSPQFLYLGGEGAPHFAQPAKATGPQPVDGWQLANRLSYLLWSSAPDEALHQAAAQNTLRDPAVLRAQVKRMIADPKSAEFVRSFTGQWLGVRNFDNGTPPNRDFYKHYDDPLRDSSYREPLEFFTEVLQQDLSLLNFISSDFLMVNERLAKHYGMTGVEGDGFRRVAAPADGRRGGVLGMAGVLTYLADGNRTLPVRRATWVLDALWNQPVPPPPPDAGELTPIKGKNLSVRERLDQHRLSENCASCHKRVDPFGLALENYDATGLWRDRQNGEGMKGDENDPVLDVSGQLPSGSEFNSVQEFKTAMLAEKDAFVKGFAEKLLCYALGRPIGYGDHLVVEQVATHAARHDYHLQEVIQAVVASPFFLTQ